MATSPAVSLLIPNRNNEPALELVLGRLATNTTYENAEVVVVDDGSTDASRAILRRWRDSGRFARFTLVEREHSGVVETLNAGLDVASGELVVQLDADASVETPDWVQRMVGLLCSDERVGVVTGKVVMDDGRVNAYGVSVVNDVGMYDRGTTILERRGRRTLHSRLHRPLDAGNELGRHAAEVDGGIGCCMMYRKADALAAGGYDPGFSPVWFDDLDLTLSIRKLGKKVFFTPEVFVCHRLSMRQTREPVSHRRAWMRRRRDQAAELLPPRARYAVANLAGIDGPPPEQMERLRHHYAYWREKWGFDFLNPDLDRILARYGGSEVCWAYDEEMRATGEQILGNWREGAGSGRA